MNTQTAPPWNFHQGFAWRVSTILVVYIAVFWALKIAQLALPKPTPAAIDWIQEVLAPGAEIVWLPAAVLSLVFFVMSVWKKNPQIQFLLELWVALLVVLATPAY
jgi:hypothetical protein